MTRTRKTIKSIITGLAFAAMASAFLVAPAAAAGSFSLTILPSSAQDAQAMRVGMQIFSLLNAMENGASVSQNGVNNLAGVGQNGVGNNGLIYQEGNGHSANLQLTGNNNSYGIFQFGEDTNVDVSQYGNGHTGATFVFGF